MSVAIGNAAERRAAEYLQSQGLQLRDQQARCRQGELDLVLADGNCWVFVEVKARRSQQFGGGLAAVTASKQARLRSAANWYLSRHRATDQPCRFDVVEVNLQTDELTWIRNAF
ncbi:YraN family protein [Natronospirillum operosum]|uniref:UPF0102 protein E4656_11295 n=1 Tax=Natronospirillum operosum TaxID=2759953 RepID=A0A4Z0WEI3_9GAMM|nr:YraN family protein [Natronospirillum operosum]TGG92716.1 YraN family protein [Natronospirillum operosum]